MAGLRGSMPVAIDHLSNACRSSPSEAGRSNHDPAAAQPLGVVRDRLGEFLLAGDHLGEVELAAELRASSNRVDIVAALAATAAQDRPAGPPPTTAIRFFALVLTENEAGFASGARVHDAARGLAGEVVVEAGLVARDADVDRGAVAASPCWRTRGRPAWRARATPCQRRRARGSLRRPPAR